MGSKEKRNVYLIQASAAYGEQIKTAYLPYAAGCIAAYAFSDEIIRRNYSLGRFVFLKEDIDKAIDSMENPFFAGFSCYVWNMEYNIEFSKKLKERYPDVIIAFGGHNVCPDGSDLDKNPQVDIVMHGEGEVTFKSLLLKFVSGEDISDLPNISYRAGNKTVTTKSVVYDNIKDYPSPYLEGYFDDIINNSGIKPSMIWETNRGCPNHCAFCDWGVFKKKISCFDMSRVSAEIDWMVKNKIEYIYCADSNFGMFSRDKEIADMIIDAKKKYGYPQMFRTNFSKNNDDAVFEISQKLISNGAGKSPTLSFQSLSPVVLENIGRKNMDIDRFKYLMKKYNEAGVPVYSELILGLPGETYDSFCDGINSLLEANQHTAISIYPCELLPNSEMGSDYFRKKFEIKTVRTKFEQYHSAPEKNEITEYTDVVVSTASMNESEWQGAYIFEICVQALHNLGLTRNLAVYLYKEKNISYRVFYEKLIDFFDECPENSVIGSVYGKIKEYARGITEGKNSFSCEYGEKETLLWSFDEYMFLCFAKAKNDFYNEIRGFSARFGIEKNIFDDLMKYQSAVIKQAGDENFNVSLDYDFYGYFTGIYCGEYKPLKKVRNTLFSEDSVPCQWDVYARLNVWYGRRNDAQMFTGRNNTVKQVFLT